METFTHGGMRCVSINGKDFFLIRGYAHHYRQMIFIQMSGSAPLNKEDLPSKGWEVFRTRAGGDLVWTAYQKAYFQYRTERADPVLAFVGTSTEGSCFLALRQIARRFNLGFEDELIYKSAIRHAAGESSHWRLERLQDQGNSNVDAVLVDFGGFNKEDAEALFRGG